MRQGGDPGWSWTTPPALLTGKGGGLRGVACAPTPPPLGVLGQGWAVAGSPREVTGWGGSSLSMCLQRVTWELVGREKPVLAFTLH